MTLNIVVCVKQTPLPTAEKTLLPDGRLDRAATEKAMSGYDEVAVEEALRVQEQHAVEAQGGDELVPIGLTVPVSRGSPINHRERSAAPLPYLTYEEVCDVA